MFGRRLYVTRWKKMLADMITTPTPQIKCTECGYHYEDHGITEGICPSCFLDIDSVKGNEVTI